MNADHSRRTFLLGGLATGAVLLAGKTFLHPSAAHAATEAVTLDACVNMTPGEMADRSQYVMAAWKYLQDAAAEIGNPGLRAAVLDIMKNPAPLLAEGDAKAIMAELKGQGLLAQDAKAVFPTCASTKKSPQPFYTAPGSGWNSHHIYPGGLVTHTALNVASCKALYDNYADMFGLKLDRDVVLASQLLHDLHKPWVFQWQADGTCRKEEPLAATGEHHVLSIAESLRRGLFAVGRLDKDTEGLLLVTDDGALSHALMSPSRHVSKVYEAELDGTLVPDAAERFGAGLMLRDGTVCRPALLELLPDGRVRVTLHEGKYHQVKRMIAACGATVTFLKRVQLGGVRLDESLAPGEFRELSEEELGALRPPDGL